MKTKIHNTPEQSRLIANMMAARRNVWRHDGRAAWMFPEFVENMTTGSYVKTFTQTLAHRHIVGPAYTFINRPAPVLRGPEVIDESEQLELLGLLDAHEGVKA